jgi:hypothetical protein
MTLFDLSFSILIQGNVAVKVFDESGNEKESRFYSGQSDFDTNCCDAFELEDLEVTYIYPSKAPDGTPWLVIEVTEAHEI